MSRVLVLTHISRRKHRAASLVAFVLTVPGIVFVHWAAQPEGFSLGFLVLLPALYYILLTGLCASQEQKNGCIAWILSMPFAAKQIVSSRYLLALFRALALCCVWALVSGLWSVFSFWDCFSPWNILLLLSAALNLNAQMMRTIHQDLLPRDAATAHIFTFLLGCVLLRVMAFLLSGLRIDPFLAIAFWAFSIIFYAAAWRRSWKDFEIWEW